MRHIVWRGTWQETLDLLAAVQDHCSCTLDQRGVRRTTCPAHRMLVEDQHVLDRLLFARRGLRARGLFAESPAAVAQSGAETCVEPYYFTPTSRSAVTVDEFLAICRSEPEVAAFHLRQGYFEPWLRDMGQPNLADLSLLLRGAAIDRFLSAVANRTP